MTEIENAVAAWLGLFFGITGIGAVLTFVVRFLRDGAGGLR